MGIPFQTNMWREKITMVCAVEEKDWFKVQAVAAAASSSPLQFNYSKLLYTSSKESLL